MMFDLFLFSLDRLLALNPITVDNKALRIFIHLSEIYPAMILQQLISEYCTLNSLTIEGILGKEKHNFYHKRIQNKLCCICVTEMSTFENIISEKQWNAFYETNEGHFSHSCPLDLCCERFSPKMINIYTWDISICKSLILNIPDIMTYMIQRLFSSDFDQFLKYNQHVIYHSKEVKWCCKCYEVPAEKQIINEGEWSKLFKKEDNINCQIGNTNCCCQYSVRNGIKCTDIEDVLLIKIVNVAGPIAVLNKIERDAFLYFLKWSVDGEPLRRVLTNLLKIIDDKMFYGSIATFETTAKQSDARKWIARHLRKQEVCL